MADPRTEPDVQVIERENNNTTDPKANQVNPWFDRPEPVDSTARAPERDGAKVTGVPFAGEEMPSTPKAKPSGEQSLLNWIPGKKAPLN
jgi:hypothetical protein